MGTGYTDKGWWYGTEPGTGGRDVIGQGQLDFIGFPRITYPGNNATQSPSQGFEWKGSGPAGTNHGNWYNPQTKEMLAPDFHHPPPIPPHWDYKDKQKRKFRIFQDGKKQLVD
jgi:hypothetical protein